MDDALLVRGLERVGNLSRDRQRLVDGIGPRAMRSASVGPSTSSMTSAVHAIARLRSRRSRRCSDGSATASSWASRLKRASAFGITARKARGRTLSATSRVKLGVARAIHLAHAAGADERDDLVGSQADAGRETHECMQIICSAH